MMDKLKMAVAVLLLAGAIGAFYYFGEQSTLIRVSGLLTVAVVSALILLSTAPGRTAKAFFVESRQEARKVVWPSRKETTQTTMFVVAMVMLVAIFLWMLDMFLGWAVRGLTV